MAVEIEVTLEGGKKGENTDWFVNSKAKGNRRCFRCPKESTARADCSNSLLLCLAANKNSIYMIKLDLFLQFHTEVFKQRLLT